MAFRAAEAAQHGLELAISYYTHQLPKDRAVLARSRQFLLDIVQEIGPVVSGYPSWHPLVRHKNLDPLMRYPSVSRAITSPNVSSSYQGLDHTIFFTNGFIACPYGDGKPVLDSVLALPQYPAVHITAERLSVPLYAPGTTPILVRCQWETADDGTVPLAVALPLLLEAELPCRYWSDVAETWETMRPFFLGTPHGALSSLFINQATGQTLKSVWNILIKTGMFGPVYDRLLSHTL